MAKTIAVQRFESRRRDHSVVVGNTLVSDEDYDRVRPFTWRKGRDRPRPCPVYRQQSPQAGQPTIFLHREILGLGPLREDPRLVIHLDGDLLNNTRENLRVVTRGERKAFRQPSWARSGGYHGVERCGGRWTAHVRRKGVGTYDTEHEAALAYNHAARLLYGEFATLNVIPPDALPPASRQEEGRAVAEYWLARHGRADAAAMGRCPAQLLVPPGTPAGTGASVGPGTPRRGELSSAVPVVR